MGTPSMIVLLGIGAALYTAARYSLTYMRVLREQWEEDLKLLERRQRKKEKADARKRAQQARAARSRDLGKQVEVMKEHLEEQIAASQ